MTTAEDMPLISRTRVRRSRKAPKRRPLQDPRLGTWILAAMLALTVAFAGFAFRSLDLAGRIYGPLAMGLSHTEVRYFVGGPNMGKPTPATWEYQLPEGGHMVVDFDPASGRVARIMCEEAMMSPAACPTKLGLPLGTPEDEIWYRLGEPTRQDYAGDVKRLSYDDIGVTFSLRRFMLYKVEIDRTGSAMDALGRTVRYLMP